MSEKQAPAEKTPSSEKRPSSEKHQEQVIELETRIAFLEDTVESLNGEVADLSQQFELAKRAIQMMHQKLEQVGNDDNGIKNVSDEPPPPHY